MSRKRNDRTDVQGLNLMDTPRTWFHWNGNEHNVKGAPADIFDVWIRQYVDDVVNVDTSTWEIFHRWGIINACISGQFLALHQRPDGSQILEEKSSDSTSNSEVVDFKFAIEPAAGE